MLHAATETQEVNVSEWLKDIDANGSKILQAIKDQEAVITTAKGFEKIRQKFRDDTQAIIDLSGRNSDLNSENVVLLNTLIYFLQAFNGVAANGPAIFNIISQLGITPGAQVSGKSIMLKLISNTSIFSSIMENIRIVGAGFDASYISKIDANALLPILSKVNFDFSHYRSLIEAAEQFKSPEISVDNG